MSAVVALALLSGCFSQTPEYCKKLSEDEIVKDPCCMPDGYSCNADRLVGETEFPRIGVFADNDMSLKETVDYESVGLVWKKASLERDESPLKDAMVGSLYEKADLYKSLTVREEDQEVERNHFGTCYTPVLNQVTSKYRNDPLATSVGKMSFYAVIEAPDAHDSRRKDLLSVVREKVPEISLEVFEVRSCG